MKVLSGLSTTKYKALKKPVRILKSLNCLSHQIKLLSHIPISNIFLKDFDILDKQLEQP